MSKNTRLLLILIAIAVGMLGVGYSFVPLYRAFCQVFGIPVPEVMVGRAGEAKDIYIPEGTPDRFVTVRFMANEAQGMPVELKALDRKLKVKIGEPVLTAYEAYNAADRAIDGVAIHMLAGLGRSSVLIDNYVDLQQCFCFEQQRYPAGQEINLPLSFTVTPDLPKGIHTITFSYTLFESTDKAVKPAVGSKDSSQ